MVLDMYCDQQQQGLGNMVNYPMNPVLRGGSHPITQNMDNIVMYLASGISFSGKAGISFEPILQSSVQSGWIKAPEFKVEPELYYNPAYELFTAGPINLAAILSGSFDSYFTGSEFAKTDPGFVAKSPKLKMVDRKSVV